MNKHIAICCADEMIVGRWYKIITFPAYDEGLDSILDYKVTYTCDSNDCALMLHDTVYIKKAGGSFTVYATDMNGYTCNKTINTIEEPDIDRDEYTIVPSSYEDLKSKVMSISSGYINIPKGEYVFEFTTDPIVLNYGTIIDFNGSTVFVTTKLKNVAYSGFAIIDDYCGIRNINFIGIDVGKGSSYQSSMESNITYEKCSTIVVKNGDYCKIENVTYKDLPGFNLSAGLWLRSSKSRWRSANNYNGYIDDSGQLVECENAWTMTDMVPIDKTDDYGYTVGVIGWYYGPVISRCRLYDIAFYDSNKNLLHISRDHQFYRRYYYPENAEYVRYGIWTLTEPEELSGYDYDCIMAMWGKSAYTNKCGNVKELIIDNIRYYNHASGSFSGTGWLEDIHINRVVALGDGWTNNWCFDFEDGWEAMVGGVVSHSAITGQCVAHSIQGITYISSILGTFTLATRCYFASLINSITGFSWLRSTRGCVTAINSHIGSLSVSDDSGGMHNFGDIDAETAKYIREKCEKLLS